MSAYLSNLVERLQGTPLSTTLREGPYYYPVLLVIHVLTIGLFGGMVLLSSLRVMGVVLQDVPASDVLRQFRPWKWLAFGILFVTGIFLTLSDPVEYHDNIMFWVSLAVLALAGWNAWKFHNGVYRRIVEWDNADPAPRDARLWALRSLILWTSLIFISRAIAFF